MAKIMRKIMPPPHHTPHPTRRSFPHSSTTNAVRHATPDTRHPTRRSFLNHLCRPAVRCRACSIRQMEPTVHSPRPPARSTGGLWPVAGMGELARAHQISATRLVCGPSRPSPSPGNSRALYSLTACRLPLSPCRVSPPTSHFPHSLRPCSGTFPPRTLPVGPSADCIARRCTPPPVGSWR